MSTYVKSFIFRSDISKQTSPAAKHDSTKSLIPLIEVMPFKTYSLHYYKGYFDTVASFRSLAVLADGQKVIVGGHGSVLLFSPEMVHLKTRGIRKQPLDVTSYKENEVIIVGHGQGRFTYTGLYKSYFMETTNNSLLKDDHEIETIIQRYKVIAITSCNGKIYVICDTVPPSIKLFERNRPTPIWSRDKDKGGKALFRNPTNITSFEMKSGVRVVVADRLDTSGNLVLLDGVRGKILNTYQASLRNVVGLTTDKYNNIFVCYNSPNAISVLQNDLSNERVVYKTRNLLTNPCCIAYDHTKEQLLVIDNGDKLHTYKLSYKQRQ